MEEIIGQFKHNCSVFLPLVAQKYLFSLPCLISKHQEKYCSGISSRTILQMLNLQSAYVSEIPTSVLSDRYLAIGFLSYAPGLRREGTSACTRELFCHKKEKKILSLKQYELTTRTLHSLNPTRQRKSRIIQKCLGAQL